jgi:PDZ domain-containing protein
LQAGDVIESVDGAPVRTPEQLRAIISADRPGDTITLTVRRAASSRTLKATLGSRS